MLKKLISTVIVGCMMAVGSFAVAPAMCHAKQLTEAEKQEKNDQKYLGFTRKKLDGIQSYLDDDNLVSARRDIGSAAKYYEKLSDDFKQSEEGVSVKSEIDAFEKKIGELETASQENAQNARELINLKAGFGSSIRPYLAAFAMMQAGKDNDRKTYSLDNVEALIEAYGTMGDFEPWFKEQYAFLIEQAPTYAYEGASVTDVLDFLKNKTTYRDRFVTMICEAELDDFAQTMEEAYIQLQEKGFFSVVWMNELYGDLANEAFGTVKTITPYYAQIGKTAPKEKLDAIAAYKPKLRDLLEKTAKKGSL